MQITILKHPDLGEYRVPGPEGTEVQAYYTDDLGDAIGTAKYVFGDSIMIRVIRRRYP